MAEFHHHADPNNIERPRRVRRRPLDFEQVNRAAMGSLLPLLQRWAPGGRIEAGEYTALNPVRVDRHIGSFRVNLHTGRWADFAIGKQGRDVISLAAYLFGLRQGEAAGKLAETLGLEGFY